MNESESTYAARRLARELKALEDGQSAINRTRQIAFSTIAVEGPDGSTDVHVPDALTQGVRAHESIARIDDTLADAEAQIAEGRAQLDAAQVVLDELAETDLPQLRADLSIAVSAVEQAQADVDEVTDVLLPAVAADVADVGAQVQVLQDTTLPALQTDLDETAADVADLTAVTLPAMEAAIATAQAAADGAVRTYYQASPPWPDGSTQPDTSLGDMWYRTSDDTAHRWNGTVWAVIRDDGIASALAAANDAQVAADAAQADVDTVTGTTIPALNQQLASTNQAVTAAQAEVDAAQADIAQITTVTLPDFNALLTAQGLRGENLVLNGSGELGTTRYWPGTISLAPDKAPSGYASTFSADTTVKTLFQTETYAIAPTETYRMSAQIMSLAGVLQYLAIEQLDADGLSVRPFMAWRTSALDTTLAATLTPGATSFVLANGADWPTSFTGAYYLGLFPYTTGTGQVFTRSEGYTRNVWVLTGATRSGNTVTLAQPWSGPTVAAGTEVGLMRSGNEYIYPQNKQQTLDGEFELWSGTFGGGISAEAGADASLFRPGTAKVRVGLLLGRSGTPTTSYFTGVRVVNETTGVKLDAVKALQDSWTTTGTTTIDGGKITADSITAGQLAANSVGAGELVAGAVIAGKIAANAVTAATIAAEAVVAGKIAAGVVSTNELAAGAVTAAKIAANAVTANAIAAGTITANELAAGSVTANAIAAGTITAAKLAAGTITAASGVIGDAAIVTAMIANLAVTDAKIGSLDAAKINTGFLNADRINANTITTAKIAAGAVTATELATNAVTAAKVAAGAIIAGKIGADAVTAATIAANAVTANSLAAGAVIAGKIAADAVTATTIATNAVTTAKIAAGAVTATEIATNAITAVKIAAGAITADKIAANAIIAEKIAAGAVTALALDAGAVTAQKLAAGAVTTDALAAGVVTSEKITGSDIVGKRFLGSSFIIADSEGLEMVNLSPGVGGNFATFGAGETQATIGSDGTISGASGTFDELSVGGSDLATILESLPRGVLARASSVEFPPPIPNIGSERGLSELRFQTPPGNQREYRVVASSIAVASGTREIYFRIRMTTDGTRPTVSSPGIGTWRYEPSSSYRDLQFGREYAFPPDTDVRLLLTIGPGAGGTGTVSFLGDGPEEFSVIDEGLWSPRTGVASDGGASGQAPKQNFDKTYTASWAQSYQGNGAVRPNSAGKAYQGYTSYWPAGGVQRSLIGFPTSMQSDLSGSTITSMSVYLYFEHWYAGSGGTAAIGLHGSTSAPSSASSGITGPVTESGAWPRGAGRWVNIPQAYWAGFASGTYRGIALFKNSTSSTYYGYAQGAGSAKIRVKYTK